MYLIICNLIEFLFNFIICNFSTTISYFILNYIFDEIDLKILIRNILFIRETYTDIEKVNVIDKHLMKNSLFKDVENNEEPGTGIHITIDNYLPTVYIKESGNSYREVSFYNIYTLRYISKPKFREFFYNNHRYNDDECLYINKIVSKFGENFPREIKIRFKELKEYDYQSKVLDDIVKDYEKKYRSSCIIKGKPGIGKSVMGRLLAKKMIKKGYFPTLVEGFDCTTQIDILSIMEDLENNQPIIVMLDEFDISCDETYKDKDTDKECHAKNKTSLNNFLDTCNVLDNLIIIATTNNENIEEDYPEYTRDGRFDRKYLFES